MFSLLFLCLFGDKHILIYCVTAEKNSIPFSVLYNLIVPKDNLLRRVSGLIDFTFIYDGLVNMYCSNNGCNPESPIRKFNLLLLKMITNISDFDVVERSRYDLSLRYFLERAPEEGVNNPSSLTKFRKLPGKGQP